MPEIIYQTRDYAVVLKQAGIVSEKGSDAKQGMVDLLEAQLNQPVFPVHRLDREVEGIMLFALNEAAAAFYSRASADHRLAKTYLAVVPGVPESEEGRWTDLLYHDRARNKTYVVTRPRKGVREAILDYRIVETIHRDRKVLTLLEIQLQTGRTHQIRVQCASRGLPLPGDRKYGGSPEKSIGLYAYRLSFPAMGTDNMETWTAPPPSGEIWNQFSALSRL